MLNLKRWIIYKIHQDNAFFNLNNAEALTCWVAIDKSDKDNGGLFYYKGSSKLGLFNHIPEGNLGASMTIKKTEKFKNAIKKFKKIFIDVCPGDCVIHDALVVHGSKSNISYIKIVEHSISLLQVEIKLIIKNLNFIK